jgi:hypothetical protein
MINMQAEVLTKLRVEIGAADGGAGVPGIKCDVFETVHTRGLARREQTCIPAEMIHRSPRVLRRPRASRLPLAARSTLFTNRAQRVVTAGRTSRVSTIQVQKERQ